MHDGGAMLCSACTGALLLAETGLLDGRDATMHWAHADTFRKHFPAVRLRVEEPLIVAGDRGQFVMSGAASSWTDLVLYLIARHIGPAAARAVAKFLGLAPYVAFDPPRNHSDAVVRRAQEWLHEHCADPSPVGEVCWAVGYEDPTFFRRLFKRITGLSPARYRRKISVPEGAPGP